MAGEVGWPNQLWQVYLLLVVTSLASYFVGAFITGFIIQVRAASSEFTGQVLLRAGLPVGLFLALALGWSQSSSFYDGAEILWIFLLLVIIIAVAVFSLVILNKIGRRCGAYGFQLALFTIIATVISGTLALGTAYYCFSSYSRNHYFESRQETIAKQNIEAEVFLTKRGLPFPRATFYITQNLRGEVPFGSHEDKSLADRYAEQQWTMAYDYSLMYYTDMPLDDLRDMVVKGLKSGGYQVLEDKAQDPAGNSLYLYGKREGELVYYKCIPDPLGGKSMLYTGPPQMSISISIFETYADLALQKAGKLKPVD